MKDFIKAVDDFPLIVKLVLALPGFDVIWSLYKLFKSYIKNNSKGIAVGVFLIFLGPIVFWIVDLFSLLFTRKVIWFD